MLPVGNNVEANGAAPLVVINQLAPIYVSFSVPDRYLNRSERSARSARCP